MIIWLHDKRVAHQSPYAGLSDDEVSPLDLGDSNLDDDMDSNLN